MVGPLKGGTHKQRYLLVMVDKFTKWIEAKAVLTALASIHLVNLSTMSNKYLCLWVPPLRGPTMSSPQTANGQVMGIVLRTVGGMWL